MGGPALERESVPHRPGPSPELTKQVIHASSPREKVGDQTGARPIEFSEGKHVAGGVEVSR